MFVSSIKILEYNRIDILESIDTNKTSGSKERDICRYRYFLHKNFNYGIISLQWLSRFKTKSYEF